MTRLVMRLTVITTLAAAASASWSEDVPASTAAMVTRTKTLMQNLNDRIEEIVASEVLKSRDSYSVESFFFYMIQQNPAIYQMTRIDPDGTVLNRVDASGAVRKAATVADEPWFREVCASKRPCSGTVPNRDGTNLLFRAFPIVESLQGVDRLIGVVTFKLNLYSYFGAEEKDETAPVAIFFKGQPLYTRNWNANTDFGTQRLSEPEDLTIQYASRRENQEKADVQQSAIAAPVAPLPSHETDSAGPVASVTAPPPHAHPVSASAPSLEKGRVDQPSPDTDSLLKAGTRPFFGPALITLIALAVLAFAMMAVAAALFLRSRGGRGRAGSEMPKMRPVAKFEPVPALIVDDTPPARTPSSPHLDPAEECTSVEKETKELPVIQEIIAASSKKFHTPRLEGDPEMRNRIFNKVHEDLAKWIRSEIRHLSDRLDQVSNTIRECETEEGNIRELQILRSDLARIKNEIQSLERQIPREMTPISDR